MKLSQINRPKPETAIIRRRTQEADNVFSLELELLEADSSSILQFVPGQFNMLYLFGVGEVPISIVTTDLTNNTFTHTIRSVGKVTKGLALLKKGDFLGVRGPYGKGWPLAQSIHKDVLVITGGLGCAPSVSIIQHIIANRELYGRFIVLQGVKHSDDLIYRKQYDRWSKMTDVEILLAADVSTSNWLGYTGLITDLLDSVSLNADKTIAMMCGPEIMLEHAVRRLLQLSLPEEAIYLSLERNMECAIGFCGHCQFGGWFVCKDGPVFCYTQIKELFSREGF